MLVEMSQSELKEFYKNIESDYVPSTLTAVYIPSQKSSSLYGQYIKERLNKEILETDYGFVTYSFTPDGIYAEDLYILPKFRKSKLAADFHEQLVKIAKDKGLKYIYTSILIGTPSCDKNLSLLMKNGAKIHSASSNTIYLSKEI
jgi:GNAT superfamily N-acetyltransferase